MIIDARHWKDGYMQTGRGDEVSIILRNDEGKMQQRIVMPASLVPELIEQLKDPQYHRRGQKSLV